MKEQFIMMVRRSIVLDAVNIFFKTFLKKRKNQDRRRWNLLVRVIKQSRTHYSVSENQIFLDISSLVGKDSATGIHRVVRSVVHYFRELKEYKKYRLSLVYATKYKVGYYHAFTWEHEVFGCEGIPDRDYRISPKKGDIFWGLDWNMKLTPYQQAYYQELYDGGVNVFFNIYDIIPIFLGDLYGPKAKDRFESWLKQVSLYSGVLCNSQAVVEDYQRWRHVVGLPSDSFRIGYFHLGSDINNSLPSVGMSQHNLEEFEHIKSAPYILMVSSLDPRKAYSQAMHAFERLWDKGQGIHLVIVGRDLGYHGLADQIRSCPYLNTKLFWVSHASDEYLDKLYRESTAVLFASLAEGFGLAVWEGAHYAKPLILRDLPVFKELAGKNAFYFSGTKDEDLASAVEEWLSLYEAGTVPDSSRISIQSWRESTLAMLDELINLSALTHCVQHSNLTSGSAD